MSSSSLSGRKLSGYDVGALVGAGGMGEVYLGDPKAGAALARMVIVLNWGEEVKARLEPR